MFQYPETEEQLEQWLIQKFYEDFGILLPLGGTFGYFQTKDWKYFTLINYTVMYTFSLTFIALLVYTAFLISNNLVLFSMTAHLVIVGCVAMGASLPVTWKRRSIIKIAPFYLDLYFIEYSRSAVFNDLRKETYMRKNIRVITLLTLYGICGLVAVCQPLIDYMFDRSFDVDCVNGVWLTLPIMIWVPLDLRNSFSTYIAVYLCEVIFVSYATLMVTSGNSLCFFVMDKILDQFKILAHSYGTLEEKALEMFNCNYPGLDPDLKEKEFEECCCKCLTENVKHHHQILSFINIFSRIISLPVAIPFFGGAMLLGMAAITLTANDEPRMGVKCLAACMAFSEALNMYQLCYIGQLFENLSGDLFEAMYFTRWYERSINYRRILLIARSGCFKPISLVIGKLLVLNIKLFGDLVNSAYSIFNLRNASRKEN